MGKGAATVRKRLLLTDKKYGGECLKIKESFEKLFAFLIIAVILIICLPPLILFFLYKFIMTPFDYLKYKRSLYQIDFPKKYTWLATPHADNEAYTAIKEGSLPVEYIKREGEYDLNGYFIYKDVLLVFVEPFFFDTKRGLWLIWPGNECAEDADDFDEDSLENTEDCLTAEDGKRYIIESFLAEVPKRECNRAVLFYSRKRTVKSSGSEGLEAMRGLEDFLIYEKGELGRAIGRFIDENP